MSEPIAYWVKFRRGGPVKLVASNWLSFLQQLENMIKRAGFPEWMAQDSD